MEIFNRVPQSVPSQLAVTAFTEAQKKQQYLINMSMSSLPSVSKFTVNFN